MLCNPCMVFYILLGLSYVHMTYSADAQNDQSGVYRISKSYRPEKPLIIQPMTPEPIERDYSITEHLLKNEIRACGVVAIRKRVQEAIAEAERKRGQTDLCFLSNILTIHSTFYASSNDPLSRAIFDKAVKDRARALTIEAFDYTLDNGTFYHAPDATMQTIKCTTYITDNNLIEKVIADIQKNG